jgi:hypothetical protein
MGSQVLINGTWYKHYDFVEFGEFPVWNSP